MCMDVRGHVWCLFTSSHHICLEEALPVNLEHVADSPSLLGKQVPGSQVLLLTTYADAWLFLCKLQGVDSGSHACRARTLLNKTLSSPIILGYYVQYDKVILVSFINL